MFIIQKNLFIKNGLIMSSFSLIIRCMAILFRIFLSDNIGAEGVGLYQLILSVYLFFAAASTSGISLTATRLFSDFSALNRLPEAKYSVQRCIVIAFLFGLLLGGVMFVSSDFAAEKLLNDIRTSDALKILSLSLPFMAVSACIRGYFFARRKTLQTSFEQLLEQVIEIGVFIFIFTFFKPDNLSKACCAAVFGTSAAEIISFIYSVICYYLDIKKLGCPIKKVNALERKILPIILPVTANSCLRNGLSAVENFLIPFGLKRSGCNTSSALSQYGIISGMSMPVLVFPAVFIIPFASLIIPEMSEAFAKNHKKTIQRISEKMFRLTLLYSIPVTFIFIFFAVKIGVLLYHNESAGFFLSVLAPVIPFMYLDSVVDGMLKGLNEQTSYLIFNIIDSAVRVVLTYLLLPKFGIIGMVAVIIISELLNTMLSIWRLVKITKIKLMLFDWIIRPLICILVPCLTFRFLPYNITNDTVDLIIKIFLSLAFYSVSLFLTRKKSVCL